MELITFCDFTTSAQELLYEFVMARRDVCDVPFETLSQNRSIRALLAHMVGAEARWTARITSTPVPARYEDSAPETVGEIHADWRRHRAITRSIIQAADQSELSRRITTSIASSDKPLVVTVDEILFQVLTHEIYHRAQCSMLLQHHAIDPPNFDYVLLKSH